MNIVVFLGPTLSRAAARAILPNATFLPPARHADVLSALESHHPDLIALIDGAFEQSMSVWHKEILFALEQGVQVWGAASMGAIRAAELHPLGMRGVGAVFDYFSSCELTDDDEVAVLHGPAETEFQPLTEPMVNLRATFARAHERGVLSSADAERLVATAKRLHYAQRTLSAIVENARLSADAAGALSACFATVYVDVKGTDARLLLERLAGLHETERDRGPATVQSPGFRAMVANDRRVTRGAESVSLRDIAQHAALHDPEFDATNSAALNRGLVQELAAQMHVSVNEHDVAAERDRFLCERGLTEADLERWLRRNDLSETNFVQLVRERAICRRLQRWLLHTPRGTEHTRWVLDEMRVRGTYESTVSSAARAAAVLDASGGQAAGLGELGDSALIELLGQYRPNWPVSALANWVEEAGFNDLKDFAYALLHAQRVRDMQRRSGDHDD